MIHHIENERILSEVLNNDKLVLIDFFAEWCEPCNAFTHILRELDKQYNNEVEFYKVNIDESAECAMRYGVTSVPTIVFFKDGEEVERQVGLIEKEKFENLIKDFIK